jgi:two-component system sensor histidine kinase/response regulator
MSSVYDHDGTLRRMGNDLSLFQDMVGIFQDDAPRRLSELAGARRRGDWESTERAAHSLKGLIANFGAGRAHEAAAAAEQLAKRREAEEFSQALAELESAVQELMTALHEFSPQRRAEFVKPLK